MNANRILFLLFFVLFIAVFPLATVYFSKSGLDLHKVIKSDMAFHQDSIRINMKDLPTNRGALTNNQFYQRSALYIHSLDSTESIRLHRSLFDEVIPLLSEEDKRKIDFIFSMNDSLFYATRRYNWNELIDTAQFYFMDSPLDIDILHSSDVNTVVLLDGRVSRKEKGDKYLNGPILCDTFNITNKISYDRFMKALVMVLPKGNRKRLEFKSDEKLF